MCLELSIRRGERAENGGDQQDFNLFNRARARPRYRFS
jgi:hypothetical protein